MRLEPIQNLSTLEDLKPLRGYKPLTIRRVSIMNFPSEIELILLSTNLLYKSSQILKGNMNCKRGLKVDDYTFKAITMIKILDNYQNKYIDNKEFKSIKKEFGLNNLY